MLVAKAKLEQLSKMEDTSEDVQKTAEDTYLEAKGEFEALDQKRMSNFFQYENQETRLARIQLDTQKSILAAVKRRVAEAPPVEEKPPRCVVEIVSLAQVEESSD
ncbi:MAG: hypothetical protein ISR85_02940 [Kiritimatiellales bacterium]|nr:hypothetical protein [Kiritimatiellota bacterium]MBL7011870.1 hypothetical protein [Kiritimatiellales bacterium]